MSFTIRAAQRGNVQLVAGIAGPSGGGKTFSALLLARGLAGANGRIVLLDTEHGRSQMYSDIGAPWDGIEFDPPVTPERYVEAIKAAQASKPKLRYTAGSLARRLRLLRSFAPAGLVDAGLRKDLSLA